MRQSIVVEINDDIKKNLIALTAELRNEFREVTWLEKEQLYLTLKFLGNPRPQLRSRVKKALFKTASQLPLFEIIFERVGCFPDTALVRTIWVGVSDPSYMLGRLQQECEHFFSELHVREPEDNFIAHVPLGRVSGKTPKGPLRQRIQRLSLTPATQVVSEICLLQSKLSKSGPSYSVGLKAPLTAQIAK